MRAGVFSAFDVNQQVFLPGRRDDEIERLHAPAVVQSPPFLIDHHIRNPRSANPRFESRFVMVVPLPHNDRTRILGSLDR
jgi:hypothetical protein